MLDIIQSIHDHNADRDLERVAIKYAHLRKDAFSFLRGTCHLFYERLPRERVFRDAPLAWICGDLHLENFGSYKGDNRLVYFDLNDFDEETREFKRLFLAGATDVEIDGAGKINMPNHMLEATGIKKDMIMICQGTKVELWDKDTYSAYISSRNNTKTNTNTNTTRSDI